MTGEMLSTMVRRAAARACFPLATPISSETFELYQTGRREKSKHEKVIRKQSAGGCGWRGWREESE